VARFAAQRGSIGALLRHAVLEFALVDILVAGSARAVREMERQNLVRPSAQPHLVTFRAGDGHVRPRQHKVGVLVLRNGEGRTMKVFYSVAILATILVGSSGKLLVMRILMAIRASRELHFVECVLAGWRVAFVASDGRMFSLERVMRRRVLLYAELRWLPAFDGVAFGALSLAHSCQELAFVGIRRMAICALGKGQRLLEISSSVAVATTNFYMRSQKRVFCFRMVELHGGIHFFPAGSRVAGFARSLQSALVRVGMAIDASFEFDPGILHRLVGAGRKMALLASDLGMHSSQRIFCF